MNFDDRTVRLEPLHAAREELYEPESAGLRARILAAHESGDVELLRRLQGEFRSRHFPARTTAAVIDAEPEVRTIPRSLIDAGRDREIMGYVATYNFVPGRGQDELGERPCLTMFARGCFDKWLRGRPLADPDMPSVLLYGHDGNAHGRAGAFDGDAFGLRAIFQIDSTPAGDLLLAGCDAGKLSFSVRAVPLRWTVRAHWRDLPVVSIDEAGINETSLTTTPADPDAVVLEVGGQRPTYLRIQDARNRERQIRALRRERW